MADEESALQQRRRDLLRRRVAESGLSATVSLSTAPIRSGERYRLSAGQRRMWFLQTLDPDDTTLNICVGYRLAGVVDEVRLRAAFDAVAARHTVLRTTYGVDDAGEPYQVVADTVEIPWQDWDLRDLAAGECDGRIEALARAEFGRAFDLATQLPMRVTVIRTGADHCVLLMVMHHIGWDDDCWDVFFGDLAAAYNGREQDSPAPQFISVGVLKNSGEPTESEVEYWRTTLRPLPEPVELPGPAVAAPSRRMDRCRLAIPGELFGRVEAFARGRAASPFTVLLAGFGVLVRRYTGAEDVLCSVPVTGRSAAAERAIGYFGNTLLLRMRVRPDDTFATLVDAVRDTVLGGIAHQTAGIDRVIREVNPDRAMGRDGMDNLVRLGFSMRKSADDMALDCITARQLDLAAATAAVPLAVAIVAGQQGMFVELDYHADVLAAPLVEQMGEHYLRLLDRALSEPGCRVNALDMLGANGRDVVLEQSHGGLVATPATTMVDVLESAAAGAPEATALASDDGRLTYAELHRRANRLARWLIRTGVGAEDVVGLRMSASIDFVIAMLAVLKAGAAYLPIDPAYPPDRIEFLVSDSCPKLIIGPQEFDTARSAAAQLSDATPTDTDRLRPLLPGHLAYVIYTSGSTGRPKGVAVPHNAIAEHVTGFIAEWSMTADDNLLQSSSVSFDASLLDIFVTLSLGAQLIVPRPDAFGDIGYVAGLIKRHRVTVLHMVPSMLRTVLMLPEVGEWRELRCVPVGGEVLTGEVAARFAEYFDAELRNHYGPTEAVICSTHMPVHGPQGSGPVPIGLPNRNVYAYVLDGQLQPVPAEVVGELYLGGNQLARGYLGRPELTAHRFVADPFKPGGRLYRTGDLFRRNASGVLSFVGRADEQVKIRGFRIEPGEVESVIAGHDSVRHCVVVANDTDAGPVLAAYLVPMELDSASTDASIDVAEIRAHVASVLPDHMVPGAFAVVREIPLTVSGKLDRRSLPPASPATATGFREAATPTQRRICGIFAGLFGCERVSAEESFFALGGHSLLAARLVAQIRVEIGVELTVRTVFETPTPIGLAAELVERFRAEFDIDLDAIDDDGVPGETVDRRGPRRPELVEAARPQRLPLSYSQQAMWFQYRMEGASDAFNLSFALRFDGPLDLAVLTSAFDDLVARHEALRTNFVEHLGVPRQIVHPDLRLELPLVNVGPDGLERELAELRRHVFTPESGALIKPTLIALDAHAHVLFVLVHHIVTDHASTGIFFDDIIAAYRARLHAKEPQWSGLPIQYADYALWQRDVIEGGGEWGRSELTHWRDALAGLPDEITVAADHVRPPVLGQRGEVLNFTVPARCRAALVRLAEQTGSTEFMVYQAVVAVLLHKLGGGGDIAIGSPVASRVDPATENLIGLFANMVVLRNDLSDDPTLRTAVVRSRDTVLDAFAHQELPIERLVEALNPPRRRSRNPLFQTMINFRGEDWALMPRDLDGTGETTVVALPMDLKVAFLDLNLGLYVTPAGELDVWVIANADLYEPATAERIADALNSAFEAFATTPDCLVSDLELLPVAALAKLAASPHPGFSDPAPVFAYGSAKTRQSLIALLEELLEISGVEPEDNFFALGGDSIVSVKWSARANEQGLALTPQLVFEHMTIAELAAAVDAAAEPLEREQGWVPRQEYTPMSSAGLSADALAELSASWQGQACGPS